MRPTLSLALLLLLALTAPVAAQERSPSQRQLLTDLAYALGESHAFRQTCHGPEDQYWRARMMQMIEVEEPEHGLNVRLTTAFNTGFAAAQTAFPACDAKAKTESGRVAARAKTLAQRMASP